MLTAMVTMMAMTLTMAIAQMATMTVMMSLVATTILLVLLIKSTVRVQWVMIYEDVVGDAGDGTDDHYDYVGIEC